MKVSSDNVKSIVIVAGVAAALYVVYRLYSAGGDIAKTIGDSLTNAKNAVSDAVNVGGNSVRTGLGGASAPPLEDQSDAESQRLGRQNGPETGWFGDNLIGIYSPSSAKAQADSPDAIFNGSVTYDAMGNVTGTN